MNLFFKAILILSILLWSCDRDDYPSGFNRKKWMEIKCELLIMSNYTCLEKNDTGGCAELPMHVYTAEQMEKSYCKKLAEAIDWKNNDIIYERFGIGDYDEIFSCTPRVWINVIEKKYWVQVMLETKKTKPMLPSTQYIIKIITSKIPKDFKPI